MADARAIHDIFTKACKDYQVFLVDRIKNTHKNILHRYEYENAEDLVSQLDLDSINDLDIKKYLCIQAALKALPPKSQYAVEYDTLLDDDQKALLAITPDLDYPPYNNIIKPLLRGESIEVITVESAHKDEKLVDLSKLIKAIKSPSTKESTKAFIVLLNKLFNEASKLSDDPKQYPLKLYDYVKKIKESYTDSDDENNQLACLHIDKFLKKADELYGRQVKDLQEAIESYLNQSKKELIEEINQWRQGYNERNKENLREDQLLKNLEENTAIKDIKSEFYSQVNPSLTAKIERHQEHHKLVLELKEKLDPLNITNAEKLNNWLTLYEKHESALKNKPSGFLKIFLAICDTIRHAISPFRKLSDIPGIWQSQDTRAFSNVSDTIRKHHRK